MGQGTGICCNPSEDNNVEIATNQNSNREKLLKGNLGAGATSQRIPTVENEQIAQVKTKNESGGGNNNMFTMSTKHEQDDSIDNIKDINQRVKQLKDIVKSTKVLILEVINSTTLQPKSKLKINAQGLENSLRKKLDGFTYFGCPELAKNEIDFDIKGTTQDPDEGHKNKGKFFKIYYNLMDNFYYIKDLESGYGTFMRIIKKFDLINNSLVNIGDSYIVITIGEEQNLENSTKPLGNTKQDNSLNLKIFSGQTAYDPLTFEPEKQIITLGRSSSCDISINDNMLSRFHCSIVYLDGQGWVIMDGYPKESRNVAGEYNTSTNGTWIYLSSSVQIFEGMIFKTNHTLFQCHFA